jgi:putative lumazine-binding protein
MRLSLPFFLVLGLSASCAAPGASTAEYAPNETDRAAITDVVQRAFDAIETNDQAVWAEVLTEEGMFSSVRRDANGRRIGVQTYAEHAANTTPPPNDYLERWWDPIILVDGDIATVWTPYDFLIDGKFSHSGIDVIVLLRDDSGWKIASIAWNVEKTPRAGAPAIAQVETPAVPTEVFLVIAIPGQPAELRLKAADAHRYGLTTRDAVASVIAERGNTKVKLRHGADVPKDELTAFSTFLTEQGVKTIEYVIAGPPPSNPKPRA